jgi:hypothetical protein
MGLGSRNLADHPTNAGLGGKAIPVPGVRRFFLPSYVNAHPMPIRRSPPGQFFGIDVTLDEIEKRKNRKPTLTPIIEATNREINAGGLVFTTAIVRMCVNSPQ